jgi:hypothetical protein
MADFSQAYNSFSGCDIRAVFASKVVGTLQGISWSVTREKAPIYTMGEPDPRAFARGKRGIAGSLIFIQFDRHALLEAMGPNGAGYKFSADRDSLRPHVAAAQAPPGVFNQAEGDHGLDALADQTAEDPWFSDQIPPFDITLNAANEYGHGAQMRIYGIEILNEGAGVSIDDIVLEQQMTFIARTLSPWTPHGSRLAGVPQ